MLWQTCTLCIHRVLRPDNPRFCVYVTFEPHHLKMPSKTSLTTSLEANKVEFLLYDLIRNDQDYLDWLCMVCTLHHNGRHQCGSTKLHDLRSDLFISYFSLSEGSPM